MSQNQHIPSPDCAAFASLLPLVAHHLLSKPEDTRLRAHLANCAHCQSELNIYDDVDEALRRSFAPRLGARPPFFREELMQTLDHHTDDPIDQPGPSVSSIVPAMPPRRAHRFLGGFPALAAVLAIILLAVTVFGIPGFVAGLNKNKGSKTAPQATPTGLNLTGFHLHSISMIAPDEGWIAGDKPRSNPEKDSFGNTDLNAVEPIILHYKAGHWTQDQLPPGLNPYHLDMSLGSIAMVSAAEGWATGSTLLPAYPHTIVDGITFPILLHYTGGKWTLVENAPAAFGRILMRSANDGWAIGETRAPDPYGALALRYNGATWSKIKDPAFASLNLNTLAEAPDGEVWITAVDYSQPGFDGDAPAAILHYDGSAWAREPVNLANDRLFGLTMVSAREGWAVGYDPGGTRGHYTRPQQGLIVHYHNGIWQAQSTFASPPGDTFFYFSAVAMISADEGWAVGQDGVMMHYHNGVWQRAPSPTSANLSSVTFVSASEGWAIGDHGVILHYLNGAWSAYQG